jgi:tape measure domain-containing protein
MSGVDNRIVSMKFDNAQFQKGVQQTIDSMDRLKKSTDVSKSVASFGELDAAAKRINLGPLEGSVTSVSKSFMAMSTVAITALSNITTQAMATGAQLVKSFTLDPVIAGFHEYETQLNSVQTIMANTSSKGTTLDQVNDALDELNEYSDKTIYNFGEMTRNIGTFTAAGVDLDTSVSAIKGISNLAAVSGSNSQQAATAMYQLSQAIANGTVHLMDWNSVVNAGMGGEVFQDSLKETARVHGVAIDDIIAKEGSFRESLTTGWLSSEILLETLSKFTGDLSEEQLRQMGYTEEQIVAITKMGETAVDAATKVKTFSQLMGTLKETAGSGWAQTWEIVFGDFEEAKVLWTDINNVLGGMIAETAEARNQMLSGWKDLGGRTLMIDALKNSFDALMSVLTPIKEAFREIFPRKTAQELYDGTKALADFTAGLKLSDAAADGLKRTFAGLFAAFDIVKQVIEGFLSVIGRMLGALGNGEEGILNFTGGLGDFIVSIDTALREGEGLTKFFEVLGNILVIPLNAIKMLANAMSSLFSGFKKDDADTVSDSIGKIGESGEEAEKGLSLVGNAVTTVGDVFGKFVASIEPTVQKVVDLFTELGHSIVDIFQGINFDAVLSTINTGLFAALTYMAHNFMKDFKGGLFNVEGLNDIVGNLNDIFEGLSGTLQAFQSKVKAEALMEIAKALAVLTAAIVVLAAIDPVRLTTALTAVGAAFGELLIGFNMLNKFTSVVKSIKLDIVAVGITALATALLVMSFAIRSLASLNWGELVRGMTGLMALMGGLSLMIKPLAASSKGLIRTAIGVGVLGGALMIMASAVRTMGELSMGTIATGLFAISASITATAIAMRLIPKNAIKVSMQISFLASSLSVLAAAVSMLGQLSFADMATGLAGIAGAIVMVAGAVRIMPKNIAKISFELLAVSVSLTIMGQALQTMGNLSIEQMGVALLGLAGSLGILAASLNLMRGTLGGSMAMVAAAGALMLLTPVLLMLGSMGLDDIGKALLALASALGVMAGAAMLMTPIIPVMLGTAAAVAAFGAAMLIAGTAALVFATAMSIIASVGVAAGAAIGAVFAGLIGQLPAFVQAVAEAFVAILQTIVMSGPTLAAALVTVIGSVAEAIASTAPQMVQALVGILTALLQAIIQTAPMFGEAFMVLLQEILRVLTEGVPMIAGAALQLIIGFLNEIAANIGNVVTSAVEVVLAFVRGIEESIPMIVDEGAKMVIDLVNGIADAIEDNAEELGRAGIRLGKSLISGVIQAITGGISEVIDSVSNMAHSAINAVTGIFDSHSPSRVFIGIGENLVEGLVLGVDNNANSAVSSAENMGIAVVDSMKNTMTNISTELSKGIDTNPVIRPVIDLTEAKKGASSLNSLISDNPISARVSYGEAATISSDSTVAETATATPTQTPSTVVNFTQTNTSPKALSTVEIYRQTKNQLSLAKEALKV